MRKILFCAFVILSASAALLAAGSDFSGGSFSDDSSAVKPASMGGAYTALADDANAAWWNSSAMAFFDRKKSASITYAPSMIALGSGSVSRFNVTYAQGDTQGFGAFGFGADYLSAVIGGDYEGDPEYGWTELAVLASWGMQIEKYIGLSKYKFPKVSIGAGLKYLNVKSDILLAGSSVSASGYSADASLTIGLKENMNIGLAIKDIISSLSWDGASAETLPYTIRAGAYYGVTTDLLISGEIKMMKTGSGSPSIERYCGGAEYSLLLEKMGQVNAAKGRAGFEFLPDNESYVLTAGASLVMDTFSVEYAYKYNMRSLIDNTHRFGLTMAF